MQRHLRIKNLNIALIYETKEVEVFQGYKNIIIETGKALKESGHNVFELELNELDDLKDGIMNIVYGLGADKYYNSILDGEEPVSTQLMADFYGGMPNWLLKLCAKAFEKQGDHRFGKTIRDYLRKTLGEHYTNIAKKELFRKKFKQIVADKKIDIILAPTIAFPPMKEEGTELLHNYLQYTLLASAFDLPAGVVTCRRIKENEQFVEDRHHDLVSEVLKWNAEGSCGLPAPVQVIGLPFEDEKTLAVMKQIDNIWKFREIPGK